MRAVDEDRNLRVVVDEVGAGAEPLDQDLGPVGEPVAVAASRLSQSALQVLQSAAALENARVVGARRMRRRSVAMARSSR